MVKGDGLAHVVAMDTFNLEAPGLAGTVSREVPSRGVPPPLLTPDEYERYGEELERLREIRDRDLPGLLREGRTFVANDAAEEIIQIQEDQAVVDARIGRLEVLLATAQMIESVEDLRTGKVELPQRGRPAVLRRRSHGVGSPIGAALMGGRPARSWRSSFRAGASRTCACRPAPFSKAVVGASPLPRGRIPPPLPQRNRQDDRLPAPGFPAQADD
jgi:transcription elongation GreA/GreB family factor